jgi:hypothetical protein
MPAIIEGPPRPDEAPTPGWKRWVWFVGLALGAALATALVAYALKAVLPGG